MYLYSDDESWEVVDGAWGWVEDTDGERFRHGDADKYEPTHYGDLHDYVTGDYIRPATAVEAEESSTQSGDEGVIYLDGRTCYVDGPVVVAGKIIQRDLSGVGHNWQTMTGTLSPNVAEELAGEILDDSTGRTKVVASGTACIGGVWYRWGH